jgi:hypothetical protein
LFLESKITTEKCDSGGKNKVRGKIQPERDKTELVRPVTNGLLQNVEGREPKLSKLL